MDFKVFQRSFGFPIFCSNCPETLYALSTLKFKNQKSFFKFLLLLSGDIELNPGPTNFPCIVCEKGVRSKGVFCTQCGLWVHPKCDKISEAEYKILKKLSLTKHFKYTCKTCENKNDNINTSLLNPLDDSVSEETPDFVLTEEKWLHFKNRGLHFLHININSLLSKIDELRQIAKKSNATIIGITESKLDKSVTDEEVKIEGYKILRDDRNRFGGGVACYIKSDIAYDQREDILEEIENIFLNILLPNTKPILVGIIYKPPDKTDFLEKFTKSLDNTNNFNVNETYILGDLNFDLLKKEETYYIKKYKDLYLMHGFKQLIDKPTRITENSASLLDHVLTNSKDRVSQSGVINIGLSDHQLVYCTRKITREKFYKHKNIKVRSLKNYSQEKYLAVLREINFDYSESIDINKIYDDFIDKITQGYK